MNLALSLLLSIALGVVITRLVVPPFQARPAWAGPVLTLSLGAALGLGLSSALYFFLAISGYGQAAYILALEGVLTSAGAVALVRSSQSQTISQREGHAFHWNWLLAFAGLLSLALFLFAFYEVARVNPQGEWDAWSIWNLRAKFLVGGPQSWRHAISPLMDKGQPGYPLLLSALVARGWELAGEVNSGVPKALSLVLTLAACGIVLSTLALLRSRSMGWLAFLALMCSSAYLGLAPGQYADLPLSCYIAAAVACVAVAREGSSAPARWYALAGAMAAFGAWTKNEGQLFLILTVCGAAWMAGRTALVPMLIGAAPVGLLTAVFKLVLVSGAEPLFRQGLGAAARRAVDLGRWWEIFVAFLGGIYNLGWPLSHPALLVGGAILFLKWRPADERRALLRGAAWPVGALALAYFGIFVITPNDLSWHLNTALDRLLAQLWPATLLTIFLLLRQVEDLGEVEVLRPARAEKERGKKSKG